MSSRCCGARRTWRSRAAPNPSGPICQTQVSRGMRGEARQVGRQRDSPRHLRPGPQRGGSARFRRDSDRNKPPRARLSVARCCRYSDSSTPVGAEYGTTAHGGSCRLRTHPQSAMRRVQVVAAQRAQLLPPQRRVVGQCEHHPVSDRLLGDHTEQFQPFGLAGDPRQLHHPRHQWACPSTGPPARRITAPANRIRLPHAFFDQEVVERRTGTRRCCRVALASPDAESNATTLVPRRLGREVNSRTNTATWARVAASELIPCRSQTWTYWPAPAHTHRWFAVHVQIDRDPATPVPDHAERAPATSSPPPQACRRPPSPRPS